jgi:predicted GIY-YIG superfamily endonuclease
LALNFHVYILRCADGRYYVGHTDDIEKRLSEHNLGTFDGFTRKRRPVAVVYSEVYSSRDDAFQRERQLKGWSRAKKEALMRGEYSELVRLSKARAMPEPEAPSSERAPRSPFDKLRVSGDHDGGRTRGSQSRTAQPR